MVKKINIITDVKVEVDPPSLPFYVRGNLLATEKYLKKWASDFHEFIRDHRSQDPVSLDVVRVMEDVCSECKRKYETYEEEGKTFCANCGEEVEVESLTHP